MYFFQIATETQTKGLFAQISRVLTSSYCLHFQDPEYNKNWLEDNITLYLDVAKPLIICFWSRRGKTTQHSQGQVRIEYYQKCLVHWFWKTISNFWEEMMMYDNFLDDLHWNRNLFYFVCWFNFSNEVLLAIRYLKIVGIFLIIQIFLHRRTSIKLYLSGYKQVQICS